MAFFFFGTLMDADVRRIVLDRPVGRDEVVAARLPGYRRVVSRAATYPVLRPDPDGSVEGVVMPSPDARDVLRVAHFEDEEYEAAWRLVRLADGEAMRARVFIALDVMRPGDEPWEPAVWARTHKAAFLGRCRGWMSTSPV